MQYGYEAAVLYSLSLFLLSNLELTGTIPQELCELTNLKRLCICRCDIKGKLPIQIGNLAKLEELQVKYSFPVPSHYDVL